ncbi:MAG: hypothetical protein WA919_03395, partial [Coleofasciculaceae cyanobacterium]
RVECWAYVLFIHRRDVGGQFISYRKLRHWRNAIACQIQKSSTWQQLQKIWQELIEDSNKHFKQYEEPTYQFLRKIWNQRREILKVSQSWGASAVLGSPQVELLAWI